MCHLHPQFVYILVSNDDLDLIICDAGVRGCTVQKILMPRLSLSSFHEPLNQGPQRCFNAE